MVYKIIGKFDSIDFNKLFSKLSQSFLCLYLNDIMYISLKQYKDIDQAETIMKKIVKPSKYFLIEEINENNVKKQETVVQQWCVENIIRLGKEKSEIEQQEQLREVWASMDKIEAQLQLKLQEKLSIVD